MSNILLLEDDLSLINGLSFAFKKQGFELVVARTLKEADSLWMDGKYDLHVDSHHTIEDTGIVLGQAIAKALGDKKGIKRYGYFILPMDEVLVLAAIDLSGRPYLVFDAQFTTDKVGDFDTEMVKEFFYAVSYSANMNLHIKVLSGDNNHHIIEGIYKAFAKALDVAVSTDDRVQDVLSTKGML